MCRCFNGELIPGVKVASTPPIGAYKMVKVACQQCRGCRKSRSREVAMRCMHESRLYDLNSFVTLTYADEFIPRSPSGLPTLVKHDFTKFMERLRWKFPDINIREFHCGEYGPQYARPHYHALIFNFDFADKYFWKKETMKIITDLKLLRAYGLAVSLLLVLYPLLLLRMLLRILRKTYW